MAKSTEKDEREQQSEQPQTESDLGSSQAVETKASPAAKRKNNSKSGQKRTVAKRGSASKAAAPDVNSSESIWKTNDYKSGVKPVWCPGCGHYGSLSAFYKGLAACDVDPKNLVIVSGIGCSGRFSHFVKGYCFHVLHGRVLPVCQGIAASTGGYDLKVFGISGDGDALAIGGGHLPHAARRNPNMVYMILDNAIYGLTKGQFSPTTRQSAITSSSPFGVTENRLDPLSLLLGYNVSFVARGFSANNKQLGTIMSQAIQHRGFSVVHVLSPCVSFNKEISYDFLSERVKPLPDDFDSSNKVAAFRFAQDTEKIYTGVFYKEDRPTLQEYHTNAIKQAQKKKNAGDIDALLDTFR